MHEPSISAQKEEANIALKQQELDEAEKTIANQQAKIKQLQTLNSESIENSKLRIQNSKLPVQNELVPNRESDLIKNRGIQNKELTNSETLFLNTEQLSSNNNSIQNPKAVGTRVDERRKRGFQGLEVNSSHSPLEMPIKRSKIQNGEVQNPLAAILEHEQAILSQLKASRDKAQLQLDIAKSQLITAKEERAHAEYQRYVEENRRAIAIQQQQIELERQRSIRTGQLQEREYSKAQIEAKIQEIDNAIASLSNVKAPYAGNIKKIKWTGQDNHHLTVQLTLDVDNPSEKPTITSKQ